MKKKLFLIPMIALILGACSNQTSHPSSESLDVSTSQSSSAEGGENNSSNSQETSDDNSQENTDSNEETSQDNSSTKTESSEENTDSETTDQSSSESSDNDKQDINDPHAIPQDPSNKDKGNLPNGKPWLKMPENYANPIDLSTCHSFDLSESMPDGWGLIKGDSVSKYGDRFYTNNESNNGGGVKFDYPKFGLQTPMFYGTEKVELRFHVNTIHGTKDFYKVKPTDPTLILYAFDVNGDLVKFDDGKTQIDYVFARKDFVKGKNTNYSWDINFVIENKPQIRYCELRLASIAYNPNTLQQFNFGISSARMQNPILANN